tara:strand:- start:1837 stop:2034 length:198 start_codon:yes stop_codon:yes gene_type:complete
MNNKKLLATVVLVILSFSTSLILLLYQTDRMSMEIAQTLAIFFFILFLLFGGFYLYFDLKNLNKK